MRLLRGLIALLIVALGTLPALLVVWKVHLWNKDAYYMALAASLFSIVALAIFLLILERVIDIFYDKPGQKHRETDRDSE